MKIFEIENAQPGILPPAVAEAFDQIGEMQRGEPEIIMVQAQRIIGGGLLSYALEHVGDIIHRVTRQGGLMRWGLEEAAIKIDRMYKILTHPYGFNKEVEEQLRSNAIEMQTPEATYQRRVSSILHRYSQAHEQYPVYNFVQLASQQAAVTLGMKAFGTTTQWLEALRNKAKNPETWLAAATEYKLNENGYLLTFPYRR